MRFLIKMENLKEEPAKVRLDYRSRFISLLKSVLGEEYYSNHKIKPFTFAVFFGKEAKISNGYIENVRTINFRFSSGDFLTIAKFYNGILQLKKNQYIHPIGTGKFKIIDFRPEKEREIIGFFKTLSPIVIERIGSKPKDSPEERYITPDEESFEESLVENIYRRYIAIMGSEPQFSKFKFIPVKVKKEYVRHYGGIVKTFIGKFKIETDSKDLLEFIYKYGLGVRTGQGFGYLEVEDEKRTSKNINI
ncbi:putative protein [Aquifex aeolicus VF5]|uniref:CRISPR associated protein Cas6 C-terminal domain-containing protein n=2 Tax=Aquifex aeolicus TaxID=63363 RepID=O66704_AQUAE|nr:putative protein [Aquifex aeolicus VF5]